MYSPCAGSPGLEDSFIFIIFILSSESTTENARCILHRLVKTRRTSSRLSRPITLLIQLPFALSARFTTPGTHEVDLENRSLSRFYYSARTDDAFIIDQRKEEAPPLTRAHPLMDVAGAEGRG